MAKDLKEVWRTTLAQIEIKLDSPAQYKTFFQGTQLLEINRNVAVIKVSNPYTLDWLKKKYQDMIRSTMDHVYGQPLELEFVVQQGEETPKSAAATDYNASPLLGMQGGVPSLLVDAIAKSNLNQRYTMSTFVVGEPNRIAHAASLAVVDKPGQAYNPLFMYGKTGVGKTHLAQAVGRAVLERNPHKRIMYISSEGFLNDMVKAIRNNKTPELRAKYRHIDILIIDDIQLISKWPTTQTELFNTFNELHQNNKQMILIADRRPEEIRDLEDRLRSRFQGGMVVDIDQPDYELRLAILERKANQTGLDLSQRILETIARNVADNIRELEGALQKVALFNQMKPNGELTAEEIARIVGADRQTKREKVKVPVVLKTVAKAFTVSVKDLKGPRRTKELALARQVAMYVLREEFGYKLEDIAKFLQRDDHTTVMHGIDKIKSLILTQEGFKDQIVSIIKRLAESTTDELE